ncbi:hypothetical protein VLK81_07030 [Citroniella saccharovorans]|uniref:Uncharacterized protein n=1 Tax=Citroniella saccharovorans TaxID=2053367 RepID=A0AAW9MY15_9FIRM|nr:hypothetical protein [Citroniella saccharovorans]MEB3429763.1 hypothetical protein [Citroniella saccharovorans]
MNNTKILIYIEKYDKLALIKWKGKIMRNKIEEYRKTLGLFQYRLGKKLEYQE